MELFACAKSSKHQSQTLVEFPDGTQKFLSLFRKSSLFHSDNSTLFWFLTRKFQVAPRMPTILLMTHFSTAAFTNQCRNSTEKQRGTQRKETIGVAGPTGVGRAECNKPKQEIETNSKEKES
jgi:hypothetical protein